MAKMFYTTEETQVALNLSLVELTGLTRQGRLREFRDGTYIPIASILEANGTAE